MNGQTAHRWWYYLLRDAGLVEKDVMRGMHMHRARHTFAVELRRDARDLGVLQHMLGHSDPNTTGAVLRALRPLRPGAGDGAVREEAA